MTQKGKELRENFIHDKYGWCFYTTEEPFIIFNLYVQDRYRRQGNAKRLLKNVINEIRKLGYKGEIMIEAKPKENSINLKALSCFYEKMGLRVKK